MTSNHRALDEADIELIERVKVTPSLYDSRHPDFRLAYRKDQDWETVASQLSLPVSDARRRWTCLRDRYSRELKQLRLHPTQGEYGKNDFFRQMDFLRRFVRKRRERRSNAMYKFDGSWDGSMDDSKLVSKLQNQQQQDRAEQSDVECVDEQPMEASQQNFIKKIDHENTETETFPEYVEDTNEEYAEYVEQPTNPENNMNSSSSSSSDSSSSNNRPLLPVMLSQSGVKTFTVAQQPEISLTTHEHQVYLSQQQQQHHQQCSHSTQECTNQTEDDFFCKSIAAYLRQLSRRHKIKAKVEMFQILEKYIELEENAEVDSNANKC